MRLWLLGIGALVVLLSGSPVLAHHFFPHDSDKPVTLIGSVTKFEWVNPHAFLYIDVKDRETGTTTNWQIELGNPFALTRRGWKVDFVKFGDVVRVEGFLYLANVNKAAALEIQLPDGRKLFAGSHAEDPRP